MVSAWGRVLYEAPDRDRAVEVEAIQSLVDELSYLPEIRVETDRGERAPSGVRGVDPAAVSAVLVAVPPAVAAITSFLGLLRSWKQRQAGVTGNPGRLKIQLGENILEIDSADEKTIARAVQSWFSAHPEEVAD